MKKTIIPFIMVVVLILSTATLLAKDAKDAKDAYSMVYMVDARESVLMVMFDQSKSSEAIFANDIINEGKKHGWNEVKVTEELLRCPTTACYVKKNEITVSKLDKEYNLDPSFEPRCIPWKILPKVYALEEVFFAISKAKN